MEPVSYAQRSPYKIRTLKRCGGDAVGCDIPNVHQDGERIWPGGDVCDRVCRLDEECGALRVHA